MYTLNETIAQLEAVIAEKGEDYIYPQDLKDSSGSCFYQYNGQPACIVGHVLAAQGISMNVYIEGKSADNIPCVLGNYDRRSIQLLSLTQMKQDSGWTWGEALNYAKKNVQA